MFSTMLYAVYSVLVKYLPDVGSEGKLLQRSDFYYLDVLIIVSYVKCM